MLAVCNNRGISSWPTGKRTEEAAPGAGVMYNTRTGMLTCHGPDTWCLLIVLDPGATTDHLSNTGPVQTSKGHIVSEAFWWDLHQTSGGHFKLQT